MLCVVLFSVKGFAQNCTLEFTSHQSGAIVSGQQITVSGTANAPVEGHLWLFAHNQAFSMVWPQGNGERVISNNKWSCLVFLGQPAEIGRFEIIGLYVNDQVHNQLVQWVASAPSTGYPPIPLPSSIGKCEIKTIVIERGK